MGGKLQFYNLSQAYRIRCLTPANPSTFRRYSQLGKQGRKENSLEGRTDHHRDNHPTERAASTAEEFRRVAEAKARQGIAGQAVEKAAEASQEPVAGDSDFETVKESLKESPAGENFHKTGDEGNPVEK